MITGGMNEGFAYGVVFLSRTVASELCEHAQVQANPESKALADGAVESLWAVGAAHLDDGGSISEGQASPILARRPFFIDKRADFSLNTTGRRDAFLIARRGRHGKEPVFFNFPSQGRL
ncbi:hypothetical protein GCM10007937_47990 [Mesorhizobium albiziae]|nr:hypothetical protein GCM10007937_47990 [Mesorhizobium albiziae]